MIEVLAAISWAAKATHDFIARFRPEHDVDRTPRVAVARRRRGRARQDVNVRAVINGLMYVLSTGCQWRAIPKDSTVYDYFDLWSWDGTLDRIHDALYVRCRAGRLARSEPDRRHHRQPERQERGKRSCAGGRRPDLVG